MYFDEKQQEIYHRERGASVSSIGVSAWRTQLCGEQQHFFLKTLAIVPQKLFPIAFSNDVIGDLKILQKKRLYIFFSPRGTDSGPCSVESEFKLPDSGLRALFDIVSRF